jgi:hypothetical protein
MTTLLLGIAFLRASLTPGAKFFSPPILDIIFFIISFPLKAIIKLDLGFFENQRVFGLRNGWQKSENDLQCARDPLDDPTHLTGCGPGLVIF